MDDSHTSTNHPEGVEASDTSGPLSGVSVVVTRPRAQGAPLADALAARGARAVCLPTIAIAEPEDFAAVDRAIDRLESYDWVVFTSRNGAERFVERLVARRGSTDPLRHPRVAAVGPTTAAALDDRGIRCDVTPDEYVAEGLFDALASAGPLASARVLLARAAVARDLLPDSLRAVGATVEIAEVYRTVVADESREPLRRLLASGGIDFAVFTSSSTAQNFVQLVGSDAAHGVRAVCTGPVVAATAASLGFEIAAELKAYDVAAVVAAVERAASETRSN